MPKTNKKLAEEIVNEITNSKMSFTKKIAILKLLDKAFRENLGIIYLSNHELEDNDILFRSM